MNQPISLPHIKLLDKYLCQISLEAKRHKKEQGISHCKAREHVIAQQTPFNNSFNLDCWVATLENELSALENDTSRLQALNFDNAYNSEYCYYAFCTNISIFEKKESDRQELIIGPSEPPRPSHSTWVKFADDRKSEVRLSTPDVDVKSHI